MIAHYIALVKSGLSSLSFRSALFQLLPCRVQCLVSTVRAARAPSFSGRDHTGCVSIHGLSRALFLI